MSPERFVSYVSERSADPKSASPTVCPTVIAPSWQRRRRDHHHHQHDYGRRRGGGSISAAGQIQWCFVMTKGRSFTNLEAVMAELTMCAA